MLNTIFATKLGMTQAWSKDGKRLAVTKCHIADNLIVGEQKVRAVEKTYQGNTLKDCRIVEIGYGTKKLKNVNKPLRSRMEKSGFSVGVQKVTGLRQYDQTIDTAELAVGQHLNVAQILSVGDVVQVQGRTKGHGFTGVVKRYGFAGGPATHGQSDRERAVGSIGNRTTPGRVFRNKRMHGHDGDELRTVEGLTVLFVDSVKREVWLSGPIPGSVTGLVQIQTTGVQKPIELDLALLGLELPVEAAPAEAAAEEAAAEPEVASVELTTPEEPSAA
jgi:large subunit ribosomal protein L3